VIKNIQIFMLGFLTNAVLWRIDAGQEIFHPAILILLCLGIIGMEKIRASD